MRVLLGIVAAIALVLAGIETRPESLPAPALDSVLLWRAEIAVVLFALMASVVYVVAESWAGYMPPRLPWRRAA